MIRPTWMPAVMLPVTLLVLVMCRAGEAADPEGFALSDRPGEHLDVTLGGRVVARYVYAYDTSTPDRTHDTYKPFLHVFDAEGKQPITKGPGGEFTHHRGIFIGWNKIGHAGKEYDRWHMKTGAIVHRAFAPESRKADADSAAFTSVTDWNDDAGKPLLREERTMTFARGPAPARLAVTFISKLEAVQQGYVTLDGDPEHAGIQYRPADSLVRPDTVYVFPKENPKPHEDLDYPWVGMAYTLGGGGDGGGKRYSVVQLSHPDNPRGTRWSAYRNYGRFGAFPRATVKPGEPVTFLYRFLIADGEMPGADVIQKDWDTFAGRKDASAVPTITVLPAEQPVAKARRETEGRTALWTAKELQSVK